MARTKLVNGERIAFTAEEEAARDAEEQAWADGALNRALQTLIIERNQKLAATDFYALSDVTMSSDMQTYRQNLRDITNGLDTVAKVEAVTWPTKP